MDIAETVVTLVHDQTFPVTTDGPRGCGQPADGRTRVEPPPPSTGVVPGVVPGVLHRVVHRGVDHRVAPSVLYPPGPTTGSVGLKPSFAQRVSRAAMSSGSSPRSLSTRRTAEMTVVWSLPPNFRPIWGKDVPR